MRKIYAIILVVTVFISGCTPKEVEIIPDGTFTDARDGRVYPYVNIGSQTWLMTNMNYAGRDSAGSWCYKDLASNCETYGRLYTWDAAMNACPAGWHLPSDVEWKSLETFLGMTNSDADSLDWRKTGDVGIQLKAVWDWNSGGTGENTVRFTALPAGFREPDGLYFYIGDIATFWSSTYSDEIHAFGRGLIYYSTGIYRWKYRKSEGYSVRCIKN